MPNRYLRHSLASFLVRIKTDPKTVRTLLRHSDVRLTLQCYAHSVSEDRVAAAGAMLVAIFSPAAEKSGLRADWEVLYRRGGQPSPVSIRF